MPLLKSGFLQKIETWHVGLSCQYTHFMSFSNKSEHDTVADQATLKRKPKRRSKIMRVYVRTASCKLCIECDQCTVHFILWYTR